MAEALEALPIREVEHQQGADCLPIVAHNYRAIALTPTGVPNLRRYANGLARVSLYDLQRFRLKFDPYGRHLPCEYATIVAL